MVTIPATIALAFGRIANFINGELWGRVTDVSWCVEFRWAEGCRHPSQLYEAVTRFITLGILVMLDKKKHKDGFTFWSFVFLMGIGRVIVDFFREDVLLLGLTAGQYLSILMVLAAGYVLYTRYTKDLLALWR